VARVRPYLEADRPQRDQSLQRLQQSVDSTHPSGSLEGARWLFSRAVRDDAAQLILIRQIAIDADGYGWLLLEDGREGLTGQAIESPQLYAPSASECETA
jgi:hypothetical protein